MNFLRLEFWVINAKDMKSILCVFYILFNLCYSKSIGFQRSRIHIAGITETHRTGRLGGNWGELHSSA